MWILVILLMAGGDGGRAINTDVRFRSETECRAAAKAVIEATDRPYPGTATCVFTSSPDYKRN